MIEILIKSEKNILTNIKIKIKYCIDSQRNILIERNFVITDINILIEILMKSVIYINRNIKITVILM